MSAHTLWRAASAAAPPGRRAEGGPRYSLAAAAAAGHVAGSSGLRACASGQAVWRGSSTLAI
eukprot:360433-Chlamydomonas_euryale.AAC.13